MIENNIQNPEQDIMHYESDIWAPTYFLLPASNRATFRLT